MSGVCVASWVALTFIARDALHPELLWGMAGPLASALLTWVLVVRTYRRARERVTGVLVAGFAMKLVFFGLYLAVMLRVVGLRVVPFAAAFVGYMVVLYVMEALFLRRLFVDGMRSTPGA
jgi:hypothetical protein